MKYLELFNENQKKNLLKLLEEHDLTLENLDYPFSEFTAKEYTIVWGDQIFFIIKDNKIVFYSLESSERIWVAYNKDYNLIEVVCMEDINSEVNSYMFDCNKGKFIQFNYVDGNHFNW